MKRLCAALVLLVALSSAAQAACRQALALGLDVSGSVDAREYRQQLGGLAVALDAAPVRDKLMAMPDAPVRLLVFEWSGPGDEAILVPWTVIDGPGALSGVLERLTAVDRRTVSPGTGLGAAIALGARYLNEQAGCWKRTLDISGDGKSNLGPRPRDVRAGLSGITINALVVGVDDPNIGDVRQAEIGELSSYYKAEVIMGPEAFVQVALGYADYARAMQRKLERELEGLVLSRLAAP